MRIKKVVITKKTKIMVKYYVNDHAQVTGEHDVHESSCSWLDKVISKTYLGVFPSCHGAVAKAKFVYSNVDGCKYCCKECHNR